MAAEESCHKCPTKAGGSDRFGKLWCRNCWEEYRISLSAWIPESSPLTSINTGKHKQQSALAEKFDPRAANAYLPVDNSTNASNKKRIKPRNIYYSNKERL